MESYNYNMLEFAYVCRKLIEIGQGYPMETKITVMVIWNSQLFTTELHAIQSSKHVFILNNIC